MDAKESRKMHSSQEQKCEIEEKDKNTGNKEKRDFYVGAPYNFVSFPDQVFEYGRKDSEGLPSHSKLDLGKENYTGEITYLIKAEKGTPIFVGGGKLRSEKEQKFYRNHKGTYAIPGNSVRGLVRSNVQVLSCSSMADDIEDYSIMYRAVAGGHNSERYKEILDTPDKALGNVKAGYLHREKDGYYIYSTISDGQYFTLSERTLITKYLKLKDKSEWAFSRLLSENHNELQHEAKEFVKETKKKNGDTVITYKGTRNPNFIPHFSRISYTVEDEEIVGIEEEDISGEEETKKQGYVHFSGPMGEKKAFYVIPQIDNNPQKAIKLTERDVKSFQVDFAAKENQLKGLGKREPREGESLSESEAEEKRKKEQIVEFFNLPKEGEEKPVFYVKAGGRIYFGFTPYLRVFYDQNIYAGFPEGYRTDKIDYAKALFGYSKEQRAYRGRLYFTDAVIAGSYKEGNPPQYILSSPKPSSYKDYLKPKRGTGVVSYNGEFQLRGLKQYWLHERVEKSTVKNKKEGAIKIPALKITHGGFKGKIRYKNLSAEELGLILWALKLRESSWQNIGQGKPYGFGRIQIEIQQVNRFNCEKAYGLDKLDWDPMDDITEETEELIQKYKDMIEEQYSVDIENQKHVKEFFMMKESMPPADRIKYMSVNKKNYHTNREVLPDVEAVIENKKGEDTGMSEDHVSTEDKKVLENIIGNYKSLEESIVSQLSLSNACHGSTTGASRETIWLQLFEQIIPKKFQIEQSVFIIDSEGRISKEVDLAIIDHTYTPYIFHYGRLKFVPIEAVAAVIECKSKEVAYEGIKLWYDSIETLKTSRNSIARMASGVVVNGTTYNNGKKNTTSTQTFTRPIRIFCGFRSGISRERLEKLFDFVIIAKEENGKKCIRVSVKEKDMQKWYKELNHHGNSEDSDVIENETLNQYKLENLKIKKDGSTEVSLMTLNFQLNQLLMLLNNPILFPHQSYAEMFKKALEKSDS